VQISPLFLSNNASLNIVYWLAVTPSLSTRLPSVATPTPAGARFYSQSRLSTSLVTPTSRRLINRHRLLSRTYITNQASHLKPTIEEMKEWDEDELLKWVQKKRPENAGIQSKSLSFISCTPRRQQANNLTGLSKVYVRDAFKAGIKYTPPHPLVSTSGVNQAYQPHPDLYETLATPVLEHYTHYKKDQIDKTYIPAYFYLGDAGTGKSRNASEFASSVQKAITLRTEDPLYDELAQRLKTAFVFHVSFKNETPLTEEDMSDLWNAIGLRMLHQLLGKPIDYLRSRYVASPRAIFRLVAAAENVDLYNDFTGILVIDGFQKAFPRYDDDEKTSTFFSLLGQIAALGLESRHPLDAEGQRIAPFIMTCVTATCFTSARQYFMHGHTRRVFLPLRDASGQVTWAGGLRGR
jgi:hypothetical protein